MKKFNLKSSSKINPNFSMSSMTDIVFLLLIFFMISSSFDTLEGINVNLPKSSYSKKISDSIKILINANNQYYIENRNVSISELKTILYDKFVSSEFKPKILIEADKTVSISYIVDVANIAKSIRQDAIISIATKQ